MLFVLKNKKKHENEIVHDILGRVERNKNSGVIFVRVQLLGDPKTKFLL